MTDFLAHLAGHHGVFSRNEARQLGLSDNQIAGLVRRREAVRTHPSAFRSTAHLRTWKSQARGAALSVDGVLSHRSAAALWGIDSFPFALVELTIPYSRSARIPGVKIHRSKQYRFADEMVIDGLPVTGISRTVLDLAAVVSPRRLDQALDAVIRQKLLEWPDLYEVLIRHSARGRDGCGKLRTMLESRYGDTSIPDSRWNRMVGTLLLDAGLVEPVYEHQVANQAGGFIARVDLAYPKKKLAIELDSIRWHHNLDSFVADPRRKNALLLEGWRVLTFTWDDFSTRPADLVASVRVALAES